MPAGQDGFQSKRNEVPSCMEEFISDSKRVALHIGELSYCTDNSRRSPSSPNETILTHNPKRQFNLISARKLYSQNYTTQAHTLIRQ
jgi:hypothetical protein